MSWPTISFADLRRIMLGLGFTHVTVPKSHEAFLHTDSGTEIFLPLYRSNQRVAPHHLAPVRHMLDVKGLLDEAAFDRLVADVAVEHPASG
jgi:predicted RNA binding protein YcfA (HicA-like mRNA interferase family)